jgi:hypothetical protein
MGCRLALNPALPGSLTQQSHIEKSTGLAIFNQNFSHRNRTNQLASKYNVM